MPRLRLVLALCLSGSGCFEDSSPIAETEGVTASGSGTSAATAGSESADSTGAADPIELCTQCQATECAAYREACDGEPDCVSCTSAPYSLGCLSNPTFHALGACSCESCAPECGQICPGGQGACNGCGISECPAEGDACIADPECAPCLEDPYREGCAENPTFMAASECLCPSCGQECIWQCPAAGNACASCISTSCTMPFNTCIQDAACADCFQAPFAEGCADNDLYGAVHVCLCGMCSAECGVLFECGG